MTLQQQFMAFLRGKRGEQPQRTFAALFGMQRVAYSQLETGRFTDPSLARIDKIADALDCDVELVFTPRRKAKKKK